jgi:hypothetical protein
MRRPGQALAGAFRHSSLPRQRMERPAPALPLILAFSPAAKNAAEAKESGRMTGAVRKTVRSKKRTGTLRATERVRVANTPARSGLGRSVQTLVSARRRMG